MKNVLTARETLDAERQVMAGGVDVAVLRNNAAAAVCDVVCTGTQKQNAQIAVFCGKGGNGHDGVIAAGLLKGKGFDVAVYTVGTSEEQETAYASARAAGVAVKQCAEFDGNADIIIDAIFGIGLKREITGETAELIERLNKARAFKLAVDIPSGLDPDTGGVLGVAFRADLTVTFSCYKYGMLFGSGRNTCGDIIVRDVGVPTSSRAHVYEDEDFAPYRRDRDAHKGTCGRVYVIGGCANMIGAPMLAAAAAHAACLNGAGTVTVCLPAVHRVALTSRSTLAMMRFLKDTVDGYVKFDKAELDDIISHADAIDIGMGMGSAPDLKQMITYLCENYGGTLIIDADGINAIAGDYSMLRGAKPKIVLTPHVGEFKRLTDKDATIQNAVDFAKSTGVVLALKSATTIITDGEDVRLNISGTPAMAKGGSGDVLGGCITALSCSHTPIEAATIACYRNGLGAERAVSSYAEMMLTPHDMLKYADYKEE